MNEFVQGIIAALLPTLIVSILASYITVKLSMKQFYSQKWWEKKAEAYSQIMENLSYLQYCFGEWFNDAAEQRTLSKEDTKRLQEKYKQSKEYIIKASAVGTYIVSNDTVKALETLLRKMGKQEEDMFSDIDKNYASAKECITKIKEYARIDLLKGRK